MAVFLRPQRWREQPSGVGLLQAADGIEFAVAGEHGLTNGYGETVDLRGYFDISMRAGGRHVVTPNINSKTVDIGAQSGELYGGLLHFNVGVADITSAQAAYMFMSDAADATAAGSGLALGSSTGYLTGETITFVNTSTTGRTGITEPLSQGEHLIVFQWTGSSYEIWLDGRLPSQIAAAGGNASLRSMKPYFGGRYQSSRPHIEWMSMAVSYDPSIDMREYVDAPYAFLRPRLKRVLVSSAAAENILTAVSAAATASASGAITTAIPLAGASLSASTTSGSITTGIALAGDAAGLSGASADLAAQGAQLAGAAASVSVADGLFTTQITFSGAALSSALATAGITTDIPLDGAAAGAASASGDLSSGAGLGGAASSSSAASATITTEIRLSGAAVAAALATAGLTTGSSGLAGAAAGASTAAGAITTAIPLAGTATAVATGTAGLGVPVLLEGAAASVSSATGELTISITLSGSSAAIAAASASLTTTLSLSGSALAEAAASGYFAGSHTLHASRVYAVAALDRIRRVSKLNRIYTVTP